ncbi:MAG: phage baseplate assembly protein V [Pseudomonadota bacterium]
MDDLPSMLAAMATRITDLERRLEQSSRDGRVTEVDHEEGLAKVEIGSDKETSITHWVPWTERAGDHESYDPPTVGEAVKVNAPNGEMALATLERGALSNRENRPHRKAGERVDKMGDTTITQTQSGIYFANGGVTMTLSADGLDVSGGHIKHNGTVIDDTHVHTGVVPGGGLSDKPA